MIKVSTSFPKIRWKLNGFSKKIEKSRASLEKSFKIFRQPSIRTDIISKYSVGCPCYISQVTSQVPCSCVCRWIPSLNLCLPQILGWSISGSPWVVHSSRMYRKREQFIQSRNVCLTVSCAEWNNATLYTQQPSLPLSLHSFLCQSNFILWNKFRWATLVHVVTWSWVNGNPLFWQGKFPFF